MRSTWLLPALLAAILLPSVALGVLGLRAFRDQARQVRGRLAEQARQASAAAEGAIESELEDVARGEGDSIAVQAGSLGGLVSPSLSRPPDEAQGPADPALWRFLVGEIDRLERDGEISSAEDRLRRVAENDTDPWLSAWAWSTLAVIQKRAGDIEASRDSWTQLLERHPRVRGERGLLAALVARFERIELDRREGLDGAAELLALYGDVSADVLSREECATRSLLSKIEEDLRGSGDAVPASDLARAEEQERERARVRTLQAVWSAGASDWVARDAPDGSARFEAPEDPLTGEAGEGWIVSGGSGADVPWSGGAIELRGFVRGALSRPQVLAYVSLGFCVVIEGAAGGFRESSGEEESLRPTEESDPYLAQRNLGGPLEGLSLGVVATDVAGMMKRERRGLRIVAGAIGVALLLSLMAGLATARAIGREVAAARGREAFLSAVTHELKTPLASIRLLGDVLAGGGVEEEKVQEFGRRTAAEAERLARVISSVLDLARSEHATEAAARRERVDLGEVARGALRTFEPIAHEKGFGLRLRGSPTPLPVRIDPEALEGAVLGLLDNALKYSDEPNVIEIEVVRSSDRMGAIRVLDRGRGIREGESERIFEPFRRVGDELTRDRPGVGLGLALVKRIAGTHGGRAAFEPREGGGSCFVIEVPLDGEERT